MKDDLDALATRPPPPPSPSPPPDDFTLPTTLIALDYQSPQPARRRSDMGWGLLISFFLAFGTGWLIFGALMMAGQRDDHAGPIAIGSAFIMLGAGVAGSLYWSRRPQQNQR